MNIKRKRTRLRYDDNVYTHIAVILGKEPLEEERWITMKEKYFG